MNTPTTPLISIIVPIYNVSSYLEHCIEGICAQTYENLEIILVDDGSTDGSGDICDRYAAGDSRIKVLHISNGGQSRARNHGLDIATGEYIGFVDGDDAPTPDMYKRMMEIALGSVNTSPNGPDCTGDVPPDGPNRSADIVECNFTGRKVPAVDLPAPGTIETMSGRDALLRQLAHSQVSSYPSTSVWSKLFRRDLVEGVRFPEGRIHEEVAYLAEAMLACDRYVYINEELYERVLREDSTTAKPYNPRVWDKLYVYRMRDRVLKEHGDRQLYRLSRKATLRLHIYLIMESLRHRARGVVK